MENNKQVKKILIANRGEIARRIEFTALSLGIQTVAIYTTEDANASYVYNANEAYKLPKDGSDGYLDQKAIIDIAKESCVDAIHPGYGFLAENYNFAQLVQDSGIIWIGPTPQNILLLADKSQAHKIMSLAGVPIIAGESFNSNNIDACKQAKLFALSIGLPVLLKSALGGGGKGMRAVNKIEEFDQAWALVTSESTKFFNSLYIVVEKQIIRPRHIEVQIAGDGKNYIHMYERECSIQRRHQKIIEETPCNFISHETKEKLYQAALKAAQAVKYENIGTVEFLVDSNENFYFLEINTRLQVEHSVTEMTLGVDLVALQIQLAEQKKLLYKQEDFCQSGHAIECRLYAEDPQNNFAPSTGIIKNLVIPNYPFLRVDNDLQEDSVISPFFDPMLLKLTTRGFTRKQAINHMLAVLKKTNIFGIKTNICFLQNILLSDEFQVGTIHTQLLLKILFKTTESIDPNDLEQLIKTVRATVFKKINAQALPVVKNSRWRNQS